MIRNYLRLAIFLSLVLLISTTFPANVVEEISSPWDHVRSLNAEWKYVESSQEDAPNLSDSKALDINLPHTWNAEDTLKTKKYRRDASWYLKSLRLNSEEIQDQRLFIRFGAAGQSAKVYCNGELLGQHDGGYTAFTFEITDHIRQGENTIAVRVDNSKNKNVIPLAGDFSKYGGLYRSAQLISAPSVHLSRTRHGGPGVRVWTSKVSQKSAKIRISARIDNKKGQKTKIRVEAILQDPAGQIIASAKKKLSCAADSAQDVKLSFSKVKRPQLWSPATPNLYTVTIKLHREGQETDVTTVHHGLRWFRFDKNKGLFLNGEPIKLRGVNRHQDILGFGNALSPAQHIQDLKYMKEMGINWLRLAHYKQDDLVLELCDRMGFLVWEEIPWCKTTTYSSAFADNCELQLREMIEQDYNHPSVLLWGLSNEILLGKDTKDHPKLIELLKRLNKVAHKEDPERFTVIACHRSDDYADYGLTAIPDVLGYNLYYGWYYDEIEDLTEGLECFHKENPTKPIIVSEYGPGSELGRHTIHPAAFDFSEEYQILSHESYLDQFAQIPWLTGTTVWNMFDFGSASRRDTIPHVNQKGLLTFDRKKKDTFYLYKSRWSEEPVVYILSPSWTNRTGNTQKEYRVLSNCDEVELFHKNRSLGKQTSGFRWDVLLTDGENRLQAKGVKEGQELEHTIGISYTTPEALQALRINCGGENYFDHTGTLWLADQSFADSTGEDEWGAVSGKPVKESKTSITGTNNKDLFESYRLGPQAYYFNILPGRYRVRLGVFGEPDPSKGKERNDAGDEPALGEDKDDNIAMFDVMIQNVTVEKERKCLRKSKERKAVWKEYTTEVKPGQELEIKFTNMARYNYSHLCALEIIPIK